MGTAGMDRDRRNQRWSARTVAGLASLAVLFVGFLFLTRTNLQTALMVVGICALPIVLAYVCYLIIDNKLVSASIDLHPPDDEPAGARVKAVWQYERQRVAPCKGSTSVYAMLWGFSASLTMAGALALQCLPVNATVVCKHFAAALLASTAVSFLLTLARLLVRTAGEDASRRMFAVSLRALCVSSIVTGVLFFLGRQLSIGFLDNPSDELGPFIGLGALVALLGPDLLDDVRRRVAPLVGFKGRSAYDVKPLSVLDGLTEEEALRLGEEGIDSLEALPENPLPRLFFNTGFSLDRLCDWLDQALLIEHVGVEPARRLRVLFGIRGAVELKRLAGPGPISDPTATTLARAFDATATDQVKVMLESVVSDESIDELRAYRRSTLRIEEQPEDTAHGEEAPSAPRLVRASS
jgi:hypothetical protein